MRYAVAMAAVLFAGLIIFTDNAEAQNPPGCATAAYAHTGWVVDRTYNWWYNPTGQPGNALPVLRRAVANAFKGKNACGMGGIAVRQVFRGLTGRQPQNGGRSDGYNVIGWGNLGASSIAYTHTWTSRNRMKESDVTLNVNRRFFLSDAVPSGCTVHFDVEGVMMHEAGHILGLAHVNDGFQVMVGKTLPCSVGKRSYKYGDVLGLRRLYG